MEGENKTMIPLSEGARRLRLGWRATWELVLRGGLPAEQRNGRWWVDADAVGRMVRERADETRFGIRGDRPPA